MLHPTCAGHCLRQPRHETAQVSAARHTKKTRRQAPHHAHAPGTASQEGPRHTTHTAHIAHTRHAHGTHSPHGTRTAHSTHIVRTPPTRHARPAAAPPGLSPVKSSADTAQRTALLVKRAPLALFLLVTEKWEPTTHVRANESTKRSHFKRVLLGTQGTAQGSRVGGCGQGPSWAGAARAGCHRHPLQGARGVPEVRGLSPVRWLFVPRRCLLAPAPGERDAPRSPLHGARHGAHEGARSRPAATRRPTPHPAPPPRVAPLPWSRGPSLPICAPSPGTSVTPAQDWTPARA